MRGAYNSKFILFIGILGFLFFSETLQAQLSSGDLGLIRAQKFEEAKYKKREIHFLTSKSKSPLVKYNPVTLFFGSMMYFYQAALSPQISAECRFQLSCSNFSKQSISRFGLLKGVALSADRIMKCNRVAMIDARPGDYDVNFRMFDTPSKYHIHR